VHEKIRKLTTPLSGFPVGGCAATLDTAIYEWRNTASYLRELAQ
jgi:hypothetical protein